MRQDNRIRFHAARTRRLCDQLGNVADADTMGGERRNPELRHVPMDPLDTIGRAVFPVGDTASAANLVKLCGNFMILATTEAMGEAMTLSERGGVSRTRFLEVLQGTLFDAPIYKIYGPLVAEQRWRPAGFSAPLGLKDMRLAGEAANSVGATLPILDIIKDHLTQAIEREGPDIDVAALTSVIGR